MHSEDADAEQRWADLVRSLHVQADSLVAEFLERLDQVPPYAQGLVPMSLVEADAVASFDYLLRRIGGLPVPARLTSIGPSIGRDRAQRGVPLDHLLTAVRLDFRVLWHALRDRSGPEDTALLVARAEDVWGVVEDYTTTIQVSYLEETARMARERRRERSALVGALLAEAAPDRLQVTRVALALDVDPDAAFLVAAALSHEDQGLRASAEQMAAAGRTVHVQDAGRHTLLIARWHADLTTPATAALGTTRCGLAPLAPALDRVPAAARIATQVADALPPGAPGAHELADVWVRLVLDRLGDLSDALLDSVLAGFDAITPAERERLVTTALAFAACGSVQQTAARLYCHRNTVVNRLRRFHDLTGRDLARPREAALALLALEWADPPAPEAPAGTA